MKILSDILNKLRALYARRLEPEYMRPLAAGYWKGLLIFSLCALIAVVCFGTFEFVGVLEDLAASQNGAGGKPPVGLDRNTLETTLSKLDARRANYTSAQTSAATATDPSK